MTCPICCGNTRVLETRFKEDSVYRRRECLICKERFSTTEIDVELYKRIIKNSVVLNENTNT
jgi:transcriptional repressor NrdR